LCDTHQQDDMEELFFQLISKHEPTALAGEAA
jgi:hypothetical protein